MNLWQIVFRKEFFEVLRDPRTRFSLFISPLIITPLILAGIGTMARNRANEAKNEKVKIALVHMERSPALRELLRNPANIEMEETDRETAEQSIRKRKIGAALIVPSNAEADIKNIQTVNLTVLLDKGSESSQAAATRLTALVEERSKKLVGVRLLENGLSQQLVTPFQTSEEAIKGGSSAGTLILSLILPYLMALTALLGGINIANDSIAGEKERGTLETLLVSPVSRQSLVLGKFMAVCGVSLVSSTLSLVGLIWPFYVKLPMFAWMSKAGITLSPVAMLAILLIELPLTVLGAGILLSISTFARNQKEAQTYLAPVLMAMSVLSMVTMFMKAEAPLYWTLVPVTNAAMIVKQALEGVVNPTFLVLAILTSLIYAAVAVLFAARAFQKEEILLKA